MTLSVEPDLSIAASGLMIHRSVVDCLSKFSIDFLIAVLRHLFLKFTFLADFGKLLFLWLNPVVREAGAEDTASRVFIDVPLNFTEKFNRILVCSFGRALVYFSYTISAIY